MKNCLQLWLLKWCKIQSLLLYMFSLKFIYIQSDLTCIQSHLIYIQSHLICIQCHLIYIQSHLICIQSHLICIQSHLLYNQSHRILFSLLFFLYSHVPCGRTSCRKYCRAADLETIKLNQENVEYKKTRIQKIEY